MTIIIVKTITAIIMITIKLITITKIITIQIITIIIIIIIITYKHAGISAFNEIGQLVLSIFFRRVPGHILKKVVQ